MNQQIEWNRTHSSQPGVKQSASEDISFWEKKFKENKEMIEQIKDKL
jgi:hypothetical protein